LPGAELELAVPDGQRLAGGSEQHRHAVRVAVPDVHVLRTDVLGATVPVVVRVVRLARHEPPQQLGEVLQEAGLELVDAHAAGRVRRVDAGDPVLDSALADGVADLVGDVGDRETACRPELTLVLEDLHLWLTPPGRIRMGRSLFCGMKRRTSRGTLRREGPVAQLVRAADS